MTAIPGTIIAAIISPGDTAATFPTHAAAYGKGGWRSVADATELAAVPAERIETGCMAWVIDESAAYQWDGAAWILFIGTSGPATQITETGGPTDLDIAAIPDNSLLARSGTDVVGLPLDTDGALAANSDTRIASQKATKTYVDAEAAARVSADAGKQPLDATLTALAGTLTAANKIPYATGVDTAGELTLDTDVALAANSDGRLATQKATKAYVDAVAQGLSIKHSCRVATAAALPSNTYLANVITEVGFGALTVDGVAVDNGDRVCVKNEVAGANNGIYTVTDKGSGGTPFILTRATDMDADSEVAGAFTFIEDGTANSGAGFVVASSGPFTIGTTAIAWTQFSGAGEIIDGAGLTKTGNSLAVNVDSATIEIAADVLRVKDAGVTLAKLANIADATIIGNNTGGAAAPVALTASQVRTLLALVIGTNVQAWDADLDAWAAKTAPSGAAVGTTDIQTLTNKRITRRVVTLADAATVTPNSDTTDIGVLDTLSQTTTFANPTGTPTTEQLLEIRVYDASARSVSFGTEYRATETALPTTTTAGKTSRWLFQRNALDSKWDLLAKATVA